MKMKKIVDLKINGVSIIDFLFSNPILIFILMVPFFKTDAYKISSFLSKYSILALIIESSLFFFLNFFSKDKSNYLITILIYCCWVYILAPLIGKHASPSLFYMFQTIGIISFINIALKKNFKGNISNISKVFSFMTFLNFLTIVKGGIYSEYGVGTMFLYGLRTGITLPILTTIFFSLTNDLVNKNKPISFSSVVIIIISFLSILKEWVATGIVEICVFLLLYFVFYILKIKKNIKITNGLVAIFIINILLSFLGASNNIVSYVASLLNKDITLTGRTYIWELCVKKVMNSPIFGYGNNTFVNIYGILKPAHNNWLNICLESGFIGLTIILLSFYLSCKELENNKNNKLYLIISIFYISIFVGSIVEIQTYFPFMYLAFSMPFLIRYDCGE